MKLLIGVVRFTHAKDYCDAKWREMMRACVEPYGDVYIVSDRIDVDYETELTTCGSPYAEDMLIKGREILRQRAIDMEYDAAMWLGLDAFFQDAYDVERLLDPVWKDKIIAPLICARNDSSKAIARRFDIVDDEIQHDIPDDELELAHMRGLPVRSGFPGADNIVIPRAAFDVLFAEGHVPWYQRVAEGRPNLCVEEEWCRRVKNAGFQIRIDARVKVWHVHEDGIARMFKGIERPIAELEWPDAVGSNR